MENILMRDLKFDGNWIPNGCMPDCPNCKHVNALFLISWPETMFKCRDCKAVYKVVAPRLIP